MTEEDNRTVVLELIEKRRRRIMEQLRRENPDAAPERLEEFLSLLIGHRVRGRKYCKCRGAKSRLSVSRPAQCLLFGRFIVKAVQKSKE
ncbi:hypothetical protein CLOSCI_00150 [[Clostridium] scindens ATCC 35704]|uniref:hypothetical protein n=1 Tax=Clostridium scindens (strain JCM 10418 / VPI 12708) TaxID=29347 RepID=UPI000165531B|nr:hypothetical protein [[Clostridium] scindens]EDS08603.1 hypothetical protein CLOSCI_00150 [[Clostridium] scindens ATCC 35704]